MLTENKTRIVRTRMTENDYNALNTIAEHIGMTVSEYVRLLVQRAIATAKTLPKGTTDHAHK